MTQAQKMFWLVLLLFGIGLAFMLAGCSGHKATMHLPTLHIQETTNNLPIKWPSDSGRGVSPLVPPLPSFDGNQSRDGSATMARIARAKRDAAADQLGLTLQNAAMAHLVTVEWDNPASVEAYRYFTALETSHDFSTWFEVARLPYATHCRVTLSNRPPVEFYRAVNGIK